MSIKVWYKDGVFKPLEKVEGAKPDASLHSVLRRGASGHP